MSCYKGFSWLVNSQSYGCRCLLPIVYLHVPRGIIGHEEEEKYYISISFLNVWNVRNFVIILIKYYSKYFCFFQAAEEATSRGESTSLYKVTKELTGNT